MDHVKKHYPIDEGRIVARGFSMGGAACWQFATHYPDVWCAAAPGAGFSETAEFLNVFQNGKVSRRSTRRSCGTGTTRPTPPPTCSTCRARPTASRMPGR